MGAEGCGRLTSRPFRCLLSNINTIVPKKLEGEGGRLYWLRWWWSMVVLVGCDLFERRAEDQKGDAGETALYRLATSELRREREREGAECGERELANNASEAERGKEGVLVSTARAGLTGLNVKMPLNPLTAALPSLKFSRLRIQAVTGSARLPRAVWSYKILAIQVKLCCQAMLSSYAVPSDPGTLESHPPPVCIDAVPVS